MFRALARFRRPYALLLQEWPRALPGLIAAPLSALLLLRLPGILNRGVDRLERLDDPEERAAVWSALQGDAWEFALTACAIAVLGFSSRYLIITASRHVEERLKSDLLGHIGRLPVSWYVHARTGDIISRLTQDVELLRFLVGPCLLYGAASLVVVPGGIGIMFSLSPLVAGTALGAFLVLLGGMVLLMPRLQKASKASQEAIGEISQTGQEAFSGVRVLLAYGRADLESRRMAAKSEEYLGHNLALARHRAVLNLLIHGCRDAILLLVAVLGAYEVIQGQMSTGAMLEYLALLNVMMWPLIATGWIAASFPRAAAAADRVEEIFAVEPEVQEGLRTPLRGHLQVRELSFTYPGQDRPALDRVSFELRPGEKLGLVGPVGSGKSTLLGLLMRLYEPPRGTIFVDGHDLLDLAPDAVRGLFAFAPQDPFLFSDTIGNNITFAGAEDSGDAQRSTAVYGASFESDLAELDEGYETIVGERGITLSGGQKQRVSLARALHSERPALVLDDTLSAVDHATERRILERLPELRGDRSLLVSAHRLSAIRDADLILVLEKGRVRASGTHRQLLAQPGFYAATWRRQSEHDALEGGGS